MAPVPQGRDRPIVGSGTRLEWTRWRDYSTAERTDWVGSRNTAARLVTTSQRRRFAYLDAYCDLHVDADASHPPRLPAAPQAGADLEVSSGLAFAVGVLVTSVSILALAVICGWALLPGQ